MFRVLLLTDNKGAEENKNLHAVYFSVMGLSRPELLTLQESYNILHASCFGVTPVLKRLVVSLFC